MSDWDARTTHDAVEGPQWVSAAEAADLAGVTPGTVRYWARNGLIVSEVVQGPAGERTLVRLDEVLRHARQESAAGSAGQRGAPGAGEADVVTDLPARTSELAPILKSIPEIMAQLTAATDRAARAETKVEFLSAQLAEMRRRLADSRAGDAPSPEPAIPEAWETVTHAEPEPPVAEATEGTDWGAATSDPPAVVPVEEAEPGPDSIDWTAGDPDAETTPSEAARPEPGPIEPALPEAPAPARPEPDRLSLEELWARPSPGERAAPPPAPGADQVDWNEPVGRSAPAGPEPPKRANATLPDEGFYGPRRRRWFRRRK